ncbi:MAG: hypothetical protein LC795_12875 [Acidobacteria bacterium]|nr:hypothetical protein [Acidobacteriota bacterium]
MKRMAVMKRAALASVLALPLLALAAPRAAGAREGEQSARGSYRFSLGDGYAKYVEFDAQTLAGGGAAGSLFLSDESPLTYQDADGDGSPEETHRGFYISASFDGLTVVGNQAVMSGDVRDSSVRDLIGQRVLLTVEDNGDNSREPDRLTWGVYRPAGTWEVSDAEWENDPGVGLRWAATDAEREDDVPVAMPGSNRIDTDTFLLSAFVFVDAADGAGDILVRP